MAYRKRFPPCPECGAQDARQTFTYAANDGEIPCWTVKCDWCKRNYEVGMFVLPDAASPSALDEMVRKARREQARKRNGYDPNPQFPTRGAKRIESDRLRIKITVTPGTVAPGLAKRLGIKVRPDRNKGERYERNAVSRIGG